jgi:hypothetical protein
MPAHAGDDSHLLTTVGRKVEDKNCEETDAHAGDDEVHRVEERLPPHRDVECDVEVGLVTARIELYIPADKFFLLLNIWWPMPLFFIFISQRGIGTSTSTFIYSAFDWGLHGGVDVRWSGGLLV